MTPIVTQPARLRVPAATRTKFRILFVLDAVFISAGLALMGVGLVVGAAASLAMIGFGALFVLPASIGFATGIPLFVALNRTERDGAPLLSVQYDNGFVVLVPGPQARRSRRLMVVPGSTVSVDVKPDLNRSLFYVVVALKWTLSTSEGSTSFSTYFEPDPFYFHEVGAGLSGVGLVPIFTYKPLSHGILFSDM